MNGLEVGPELVCECFEFCFRKSLFWGVGEVGEAGLVGSSGFCPEDLDVGGCDVSKCGFVWVCGKGVEFGWCISKFFLD